MLIYLMKKYILSALIAVLTLFSVQKSFAAPNEFRFCGGPDGGTFMYFANGIAKLGEKYGMKITPVPTKGSIENIRMLNSGQAGFATVYAEDAYLARRGLLKGDNTKYTRIYGAGLLFTAKAHVLVQNSSSIKTLHDLADKRVAVGEAGTGAASSAERILSSIGVWNSTTKYFIGYRQAEAAFKAGIIDAVWILAGVPNPSVTDMLNNNNARLISMESDMKRILAANRYYRSVKIPIGTYNGVNKNIDTVESDVILLTNLYTSEKEVRDMLNMIYNPSSVSYMTTQHPAAVEIPLNYEQQRMLIPPHDGAVRFWREKGMIR